ncbi:MAG: ABC transporter permease [Vampirovibrio sp.]|nr:ABC transporter permease [Vampirovibrio sp.]
MLTKLFLRFIVRDLWRNKIRTGLTLLGIGLGVAILLAINLANHTALSTFQDSIDRVSGKTNLEVRPKTVADMDEALLQELTWLWTLPGENGENISEAHYTPVLEETAVWPGQDKDKNQTHEVIQVMGVDMLADTAFRSYDWQADGKPDSFLTVFEADHAYIGEAMANRYGLESGSTFELFVNDRKVKLTVSGLLSGNGIGGAYGGSLVLMDLSTAQDTFNRAGRITRIDFKVPEKQIPTIMDRLTTQLPDTLAVQRPARRGAQVNKMLSAYQQNLTTLSFISLLVGMFLIYNTMSISVIRRRPEVGILRALGISTRSVFLLFLFEAGLLGILGTLIGMVGGVVLAKGAVKAVSTTIQALYVAQPVSGLNVDPTLMGLAFIFGVGLTIVAALVPIWEAAAVSPAEAARRASYESKMQHLSKKLLWIGLGVGVLAYIASLQPPVEFTMGDYSSNQMPLFGYLSALLIILAGTLVIPSVLQVLLPLLANLLKRTLGHEARLSALSLQGAIGRTSVAVASLMIGIAMMVSLAMMIGSFRETVVSWVNDTLRADLWIEPISRTNNKQTGRLDLSIAKVIAEVPGVAAVDPFLEFPIEFEGDRANLGVGNFDVIANFGNLQFIDGEATTDVFDRVKTQRGLVVTESFALKHHVNKGDTLTLDTPSGPVGFPVGGVYYDYSSELGYIVMPRPLYLEYFDDNSASNLAVFLTPQANSQTVRRTIFERLKNNENSKDVLLNIQTNRELKKEVMVIFDNTFAITYALHAIAIVVAMLAVMNSLFALVMESRREFGILKYLGAGHQQIKRMVMVQAGMLGLLGNITGMTIGFLLALLLIYVINRQSFGWTIQLFMPWGFLIQSFILVMATAILSGLIPARLAARIPAPEVVRAE